MSKTNKKRLTDPIAIVIGAIIEILAILGVPEKIGLSATEITQIGGAVIIIAATIRTWAIHRSGKKELPESEAPAESEVDTPKPESE